MRKESTAPKLGYTWSDYRSWDDGQRWQVIDGEAYAMGPAPTLNHQRVQRGLMAQMEPFFRGHRCEILAAPTDVKLSDLDTVQPDILVVCEPSQCKRTHVEGAPTLIVEILSAATAAFDRVRKLPLYARSGVLEIWLVTPYPWLAEVFVLADGNYRLDAAYDRDGVLKSRTFPQLEVRLGAVFDFPIPPGERVEMVREGRPPYAPREGGAAAEPLQGD